MRTVLERRRALTPPLSPIWGDTSGGGLRGLRPGRHQRPDPAAGDQDAHDAHEGLEDDVAAHHLHRAQRADAAGNEEHNDAGDHRERKQRQAHGLVLHESRGSVHRDETDGAASHHVLTLVAVHPRAIGPLLARGEDGDASREQQGTEGSGDQGNDDVLLCHGIHS